MPNYYRTKILTSIKSLDEISLVLKKGVDINYITLNKIRKLIKKKKIKVNI